MSRIAGLAILCVGPAERSERHRDDRATGVASAPRRRGASVRHRRRGPWQADLRERCPDTVFAGALSARDMATVMASADLFLWPGRCSAAGRCCSQAQASGLPVLAASLATARDHVRPDVTGFLCHPQDVLGLRVHAGGAAWRRSRIGDGWATAARRFAQSRTWAASLERVYALYRTLTHRRALDSSPTSRAASAPTRRWGAAVTLGISVIVCAHNEERHDRGVPAFAAGADADSRRDPGD